MTPSLPVRSRAAQALFDSAHPALRRLKVEETDSSLVIKGSVTSYFLKQMAQELIKPVQGPRRLDNQVEVVCA
jgi:hypothetical protein